MSSKDNPQVNIGIEDNTAKSVFKKYYDEVAHISGIIYILYFSKLELVMTLIQIKLIMEEAIVELESSDRYLATRILAVQNEIIEELAKAKRQLDLFEVKAEEGAGLTELLSRIKAGGSTAGYIVKFYYFAVFFFLLCIFSIGELWQLSWNIQLTKKANQNCWLWTLSRNVSD